MKKFLFSFLFFSFTSTFCFSQLWFENFDGSSPITPTLITECFVVGAGTSNNNHGHWAEVCQVGVGCPNELIAYSSQYNGVSGEFLGALNTDLAGTCGGSPNDEETAEWVGINISGCSSTETLYLCFEIAEGDDASGLGWDGNSEIQFSVRFDSGPLVPLGEFRGDVSKDGPGSYNQDCNNRGDGVYVVTDDMTNYCWELPALTTNTTMDLLIDINGFNEQGEDFAMDNIGVYCESSPSSLPGILLPTACGDCGPDEDCDGLFVTEECDDTDANIMTLSTDDQDCDGIITAEDCDDFDPNNNAIINASGIANIMCNDNGTATDPSDDFITFELDPSGFNLGAGYTLTSTGPAVTPSGANYGAAKTFSTGLGTAGTGDFDIIIEDDSGSTCTFTETIVDPGTCSDECLLELANITNEQCNDNGTPGDPLDDFITFDLNPTGLNLGSTYTVGNASPTTGTYGSPNSFSTASGTAGGGPVTITITDDDDSACSLTADVSDDGPCSNGCFLEFANITNEQCDDNGTPADPSDDFMTFQLNPTGLNLGSTYTVANASPTTGTYGSPSTFSTAPGTGGGGDVTITITDDDDPACSLDDDVIDQGTCSDECLIEFANITNEVCNDNGTPTNPNDDYITFDLNPTGFNLATSYTVTGVDPSPGIGSYGSATSFSTAPGTAGNGPVTITITDDNDAACKLDDNVPDPGTCSDECLIEFANITNEQCDDNGTPSDPSDDFITFQLNPTGFNLATTYTVSNASPTTGTYGSPNTFSTAPGTGGGGDVTITITDDGDPACSIIDDVADQGTCSDACLLEFSNIANEQCNDNGTPADPTDDFMTFQLDPTGLNLGFTYTVTNASPTTGTYGSPITFSTAPGTGGSGTVTITITDDDDLACFLNEDVFDQGTCSNDCSLEDADITNVQCNDNGTPGDATDDFMTFQLNPTGFNLGTSYTVTNATPVTGNYGSPTTFSTAPGTAGGGSVTITVTDDNDLACFITDDVADTGTCSNACFLEFANITNEQCNDNGTPADPSDDFMTFDLNPTGINLGISYTVTNTTPSFGNYGSPTSFSTAPGTAGNGDVTITITDDNDLACFVTDDVADQGTCSDACLLEFANITNVQCNDNGTPTDPSDDYMTFDLDPTGFNLGISYTVSNASPTTGNYGSVTSFSTAPGTAGNGPVTITITDDNDLACFLNDDVADQGTCSDECLLEFANITNIRCNDNGTADPTDDYMTFDLNPTGLNLATSYTVTNTSPTIGNYGSPSTFATAPGTAGSGAVTITITDDGDLSCFLDDDVTDTGACSSACLLEFANITNEQCNDNGTPSDPSDDYITFDLDPTGVNLGTSYTVSNASPSTGNYGSVSSFSTAPGTAGNGPVTITLTDDGDPACTLTDDVADQGTCSDECLLEFSNIANEQCNDNRTPADPTDDFITFELNPTGFNLATSYTVSNASPTTGNYGTIATFSTAPGTAGGGNVSITITDDNDLACFLDETVLDQGTCSDDCELLASGLTNVTCNDNDTPADATDDFITFDLDPSGNNLGSGYTLSGAVISPAGGNYGSAMSFSTPPGSAGLGNLNITITDNATGSCTFPETIIDPGTCSGSCNISGSGISNIQCNDNGTPTDPTDDFITFDLDPTGGNLGTSYSITGGATSPTGGNYGLVTNFSTLPGTAGAGDLNLTIEDDATSGCTFGFTVTDPGTCSNTCDLIASGLTNIQCNDNGTPADATDDFITFDLDPFGNNLGTNYTIGGVTVSPVGGNYGSTTNFSTAPGTAGAGDLNITITDDADANCAISELVGDPGTCSGSCNISDAGLTNVQCNDNGTPNDPTDDFITFELDPTGGNLGTSYSIMGGTTTPTGGNYGITTIFSTAPGTAGAGDLNLTIEDDATSGCTLPFTVTDPGTCSNACNLMASGLTNIQCNDNGTPADATDDFITFNLDPSGSNLGTSYTIGGTAVSPAGGNYGSSINYATAPGTAGAGDLNITITDDADANCAISELVVDPGTCSGSCNISDAGISNIQCNDNGTPADATDDFITFDLNPMGGNLGTTYSITGGTITPANGNYGSASSFSTNPGTAGAGDLNLTIVDDATAGCTFPITVTDPGTCSNACDLIASGISNIQCNNGGTPTDPDDDFITFDLNPMGSNLGATYTIVGAVVSPAGGSYGSATNYSTAPGTAGNGDISFSIIDALDGSCSIMETVSDPGSCSASCQMVSLGLTNVTCNDNGTPGDAGDDFITFDLNPSGNNLGIGYTITSANLTTNAGSYGSVTNFSTMPGSAGGGDLNITVTDNANAGCSLQGMIVDPGTCSGTCNLTASGLSNVQCNDDGTPTDPSDDFITFDLDPMGGNLGTNYTLSGAVTPAGGDYGETTSYTSAPGTAGLGNLDLTITDGVTGNCTFGVTVNDPGSCSPVCELTTSNLANILCNDNGTPSDDTDDYFTFELNPTGSNLGNSYQITGGGTITPNIGNYGSATIFSTLPGSAGMGDLNITITDDVDSNCSLQETVSDPGSCSGACNLMASGLTNIQCNDGGTPNDPDDDFITFDLNPTGGNLGTGYTISGVVVSPSGGSYGSIISYATDPGTAGAGNLNITITDDTGANCSLVEVITDPGSCSNNCNISDVGLSNIQCNDNGTPDNPNDDYITFDLSPTGTNLGTNYTLGGAVITPTGRNYGIIASFATAAGTAGNGDLNLTLTDGASANCMASFTVTDPGTCSSACALIASGITNVTCNDNGTPSDDTDDYITFDLNPTGNNLGTGYTLSGAVVSPSGGNYGSVISYATDPGTAGAGNLDITITDDTDANCSLIETIIDPGTCSGTCNLTAAGLNNIQCNDNGTPSDPSDDYITFELNPTGSILGNGYSIMGAVVTPANASYGASTTFATAPGTAGEGDLNITIVDDADANCSFSATIADPGSCSASCNLTDSGLTNVECNDNNTPSDTSDDFITFDLNPTGSGLGTTYTISGIAATPLVGNYGSTTSFTTPPGTAGSGDLNLTITDDADNNCDLNIIILDPGVCDNCPTVEANITPVFGGVCLGESIDLEFIFNGGTAPYTVRFSDGQGINEVTSGGMSISTFSITPTTTTTYTITEAFDANNCPATPGASVTVEVFAEATNTFSDSFCEGESYRLPDGTMVTTPDTYEITLAGQSINGCDSTITINLSQNQSYDFAETVVVCDAVTYTWNGQVYDTDGVYTATRQTVNGCDSLLTLNLTFDGLAIYGAADAGDDSEECNSEAELFGMDVVGTTGLWTSPTGATITPTNQGAAIVSNLQSGDNTFIWSISTADCVDFSRDTAIVKVLSNAIELRADFGVFRNTEPIQLSVLANDNLGGTEQFTLTCINLPQGIESCRFDETTQQLNIEIGRNAVGTLEFEYLVCPEACPDLCDTTTVTLDITNDQDQVDYVITPENADGRNDFLVFDNIDQFPDNELVVYNRWGSVIYRAKPYQNDWGGLYNGNRLPEADYYYVLRKELPEKIEFGIVTVKY